MAGAFARIESSRVESNVGAVGVWLVHVGVEMTRMSMIMFMSWLVLNILCRTLAEAIRRVTRLKQTWQQGS